jgi:hypothetical protein
MAIIRRQSLRRRLTQAIQVSAATALGRSDEDTSKDRIHCMKLAIQIEGMADSRAI